MWLFVTFILTSSYTENLTSMLTFQGIQTTALDVDTLRRTNAKIGCDNGSFVANYLANVLQFDRSNIKQFASGDDYPEALTSREIHWAFLRVPFAKVLVAKHCKVVITGPTFDVGGFGFVSISKRHPFIKKSLNILAKMAIIGSMSQLTMVSAKNWWALTACRHFPRILQPFLVYRRQFLSCLKSALSNISTMEWCLPSIAQASCQLKSYV